MAKRPSGLFQKKFAPAGMSYREAAERGLLKTSPTWFVQYRVGGRVIKESTHTESLEEAKRFLGMRLGHVAEGRPIVPRAERITVAELAEGLRNDYRANKLKSLDRAEFALAHLVPALGHRRAIDITGQDVTAYVATRQQQGAANGTIRRELGILQRAFSLASERLPRVPKIRKPADGDARQGFFERAEFEAVRDAMPERYRNLVTVAYVTGWRLASELLPMTWRQVDFKARTLRLEPGTTKNKEGRTFVMTTELFEALEAQREYTDEVQKERGAVIPLVFHRNGRAVSSFRKVWARACLKAGLATEEVISEEPPKVKITALRIPHDFRRTAIRNLERAGVPRSVAMKMVGHKTESMYRRYAIVAEADLREAAAKMERMAPDSAPDRVPAKVVSLASR